MLKNIFKKFQKSEIGWKKRSGKIVSIQKMSLDTLKENVALMEQEGFKYPDLIASNFQYHAMKKEIQKRST